MIRSLRLRLALGAVAAITVSLAIIWFSLSIIFFRYAGDRYQTEMQVLTNVIAASVSIEDGKIVLDHPPPDQRFSIPAGGRYWQISAEGQPTLRSASLWDMVIEPAKLGKKDRLGFQEIEGPDGAPMLVLATPLTLEAGNGEQAHKFWLYCGFSKEEVLKSLNSFQSVLITMIVLIALFLLAAALIQSFIGLRPLNRLRDEVADVRAGNLNTISDTGPTEFLPVVREINLLLEERESAVERARARASDLAHGLKTPLTVLAQLAQKLPEEDRETALKQVDLIRQRADRQLQSARLGVEQMASTRVFDLAQKLVQVLRPATSEKGLVWHILIEPETAVATDPADLAEAMGNLLENAGKWARGNVIIHIDQDKDWTDIRISDDGPGVDPEDHARILQRGEFMSGGEEGSGLGLAISADIAAAYGGSLSLSRSQLGGLEACLRLPTFGAEKRSPA